MTDNLMPITRSIWLRNVSTTGEVTISHHFVYDADKFLAARKEDCANENIAARAQNKPAKASCELSPPPQRGAK